VRRQFIYGGVAGGSQAFGSIIPPMEEPASMPTPESPISPDAESTPSEIDGLGVPQERPRGAAAWLAPVSNRPWVVWAVILPVIFALGLGTGYVLWGRGNASTEASAAVEVPQDVTRYTIPTDGQPSVGPDNAAVTIVEFSDYQCPYCKKWNDEVLDRLLKEYPKQVRFVYRDFPLTSIHPQAFSAAEAAHCAGDQGAYWDYHRALFSQKYGLGEAAYQQYAVELGLDATRFAQCVKDGQYSDEVNANLNFAANLGISSTPTFFINGIALVGAQPYDIFKQVIDLELAGKIPHNTPVP
jgi:protein-disulfide isomerase